MPVLTGMVKYEGEKMSGTSYRDQAPFLNSVGFSCSGLIFAKEEAGSFCEVSCVARLGFHADALLAGQ